MSNLLVQNLNILDDSKINFCKSMKDIVSMTSR